MNFPDIEPPLGGFFALVSYVPQPLGRFLDQLRRSLPGNEFPQAHITLLPPRPLRVIPEIASQRAQDVLGQFSAFDVELNSVRSFPGTNVLYLDLTAGNENVRQLHHALNSGDLHHREQFEFHPHLTLGGPLPASSVGIMRDKAERGWKLFGANRRFAIDEVVALWGNADGGSPEWKRLWSHNLRKNQTRTATVGLNGQRY